MALNQKQIYLRNNFEHHILGIAHTFSVKAKMTVEQRDWMTHAITAFVEQAFDRKKITVNECSDWDLEEQEFQDAVRDHKAKMGMIE